MNRAEMVDAQINVYIILLKVYTIEENLAEMRRIKKEISSLMSLYMEVSNEDQYKKVA